MSRILLTWTLLLVAGLAAQPAGAQSATGTVRVATTGTDAAGCGAVQSPCRTLQYAVDRFPLGSAGVIQVAAGTYTSTQPREVLRVSGRRLTIAGGYSLAFTVADPEANLVVIDGQHARRGISVFAAQGIALNALTLTGLTITRGRAPNELVGDTRSAYGGAMDVASSTLLVIDVDFIDNHAVGLDAASGVGGAGGGGAVNIRMQSHAFLSQVTFTSNSAEGGNGTGSAARGGLGVGGAIFGYQSAVSLNGIAATSNFARGGDAPARPGADGNGQRADALGGFFALILGEGTASHVTATWNIAEGGQAATLGGLGIGGAIFLEAAVSPVSLRSLDLRHNLALGGVAGGSSSTGGSSFGGAIFATDSRVAVEASELTDNAARGVSGVTNGGIGVGGGISTDSTRPQPSELIVTNTVIARNAAEAAAGGPSLAIGGGIFLQCPTASQGCPNNPATTSTATLRHVTLADNTVGGGLYNQGAAIYVQRNSQLHSYDGIVSGHDGPAAPYGEAVVVLTPALAHFEHTLWSGNTLKSFSEPPAAVFEDVAPFSGNPAYVAPASEPPDYRLGDGSAAIDRAADSTTRRDLDGERRPIGLRDLGADERTPDFVSAKERLLASVFEDGTILEIDPETGAADALGSGPRGLVGLATWQNRLFGLWEVEELIELDPATGGAIGTSRPGIGVGGEGAIAIRSDGRALATRRNGASEQLWSFDTNGGSTAVIQPTFSETLDGMAFAPNGSAFGLTQGGELLALDAMTGAVSSIGETGLAMSGTAGITFTTGGILFAAAGSSLYTLSPTTGTATAIGPLGNGPFTTGGISGIAFVPEPLELSQGSVALALLAAARLRGRRRSS